MVEILDGKAFAARIRQDVAKDAASLKAQGITPKLVVILVGEDPASQVYVGNKGRAAEECGIASDTILLPESTSEAELLRQVQALNDDPSVHGILVQLPLPKHMNDAAVINAISPDKDVDGFHVINAGRLLTGQESLVPCTPQGCLLMLRSVFANGSQQADPALSVSGANSPLRSQETKQGQSSNTMEGQHAVVIGKSNIVGKPMAVLLMQEGCTVTVCHSKTRNLAEEVSRADIVVAAAGRPELVKGEWIKPGATVIDVGINRVMLPTGKGKLVGDVEFSTASQVARAITPVPGGVGPMTIACLLKNTVQAAKFSRK